VSSHIQKQRLPQQERDLGGELVDSLQHLVLQDQFPSLQSYQDQSPHLQDINPWMAVENIAFLIFHKLNTTEFRTACFSLAIQN
jgi:hypothetical protein